jgi:hypothetical protein
MKMEIRGEILVEWGHDDGVVVEVPEDGKCWECSKVGQIWFLEDDHDTGLCFECLPKAYPDCSFRILEDGAIRPVSVIDGK